MHLTLDFFKNGIELWGCDEGKEETQLKAEDLTKKLARTMSSLGVNILYNRHGDEYKDTMTIPQLLWLFRLVDNGIMPELDKRFPTLEDVYKLMEDESYTESEINTYKNLPSSFVEQTKKNMETVVLEGTADYSVGTTNFISWFGDRTIPVPIEIVTFYNNHTVTNDWKIEKANNQKEYLNNKTIEEVKDRLKEILTELVGEPLVSQDVIPVDYDEKGGLMFDKNMEDADDEDTFLVANNDGAMVPVDGIEKAISTATEYRKARIGSEFAIFVSRKLTEPDGYFAWREENTADFL